MYLRLQRLLFALGLSFALVAQAVAVDNKPLLGFTREGSDRERELEARFDSLLRRDDLREWMKRLSARPHHLGSAYDRENAEFIASQFRSFGFETEIESFDVLFPTPKTRLLEMTAPEKFTATLAEPPLPDDPTSSQTAAQLPVYHAYSIDREVTGQLVSVNYRVP